MARNPSNILGYESHHSDGTPGLEYFKDGFAFTWTGRDEDFVEISSEAYGEPVEHLIRAHGVPWLLDQFRSACDEWLERRQRAADPDVVHEKRWSHVHKANVCTVCQVPADEIPLELILEHGTELPAAWEDCQRDA